MYGHYSKPTKLHQKYHTIENIYAAHSIKSTHFPAKYILGNKFQKLHKSSQEQFDIFILLEI